ncbi:MAG: sigma-54 interaction domain-containing protein [Terriglobales bacterium]
MSTIVGTARTLLPERLPPDDVIFGATPLMAAIRHKLDKVADTNIPVLIQGESGTGKEIIAKYIHQRSIWAKGPFAKVNCPAIPATLVESELFGYERGAFTGAVGSKPGRVEMAQRGTLFLDEISELAFGLQSKLLQLLQDGHFCPIGGSEDKKVDVRIVCATNRQLGREVDEGRFRQDLYYRINVVSVHLPPLRERIEDVAVLVDYFLDEHSRRYNCAARPLSSGTMAVLRAHNWPGNVRELENVVKRYVVLGSEEVITSDLRGRGAEVIEPDIPLDSAMSLKKVTKQAMKDLEQKMILNALQANQWNRKRAARALNISYRALLYKLKLAGLRRSDPTPPVGEN